MSIYGNQGRNKCQNGHDCASDKIYQIQNSQVLAKAFKQILKQNKQLKLKLKQLINENEGLRHLNSINVVKKITLTDFDEKEVKFVENTNQKIKLNSSVISFFIYPNAKVENHISKNQKNFNVLKENVNESCRMAISNQNNHSKSSQDEQRRITREMLKVFEKQIDALHFCLRKNHASNIVKDYQKLKQSMGFYKQNSFHFSNSSDSIVELTLQEFSKDGCSLTQKSEKKEVKITENPFKKIKNSQTVQHNSLNFPSKHSSEIKRNGKSCQKQSQIKYTFSKMVLVENEDQQKSRTKGLKSVNFESQNKNSSQSDQKENNGQVFKRREKKQVSLFLQVNEKKGIQKPCQSNFYYEAELKLNQHKKDDCLSVYEQFSEKQKMWLSGKSGVSSSDDSGAIVEKIKQNLKHGKSPIMHSESFKTVYLK